MQSSDQAGPSPPPPLPPRARVGTVHLAPSPDAPPPYAEVGDAAEAPHPLSRLSTGDPRSSSTQSLVPADADAQEGRRKLLLIYIHGFMGDETSFQSFPAHVHNLVTVTLSETHVVHTKIYPKYRARKSIEHATEQFSKWLTPHATPDTDIILLGHSMGGLLSAEIVLLPPHGPAAFVGQAFRHSIIGNINFDVPFLGMHPGVISAGLSSIFNPADDKSPERNPPAAGQASQSQNNLSVQAYHSANSSVSTLDLGPPLRTDTLFSSNPNDPNYNPHFDNDVILPNRKGWQNALHFIQKHSDGLVKASRELVKSHLEFGGAMADYPGLKRRYNRLRALEEDDETRRRVAVPGRNPHCVPRVRFVNFYTASTGRPKKPKEPSASHGAASAEAGMSNLSLAASGQDLQLTPSNSQSISPRISIEEHKDDAKPDTESLLAPQEMQRVPSGGLSDHDLTPTHSLGQDAKAAENHSLPQIPSPPVEPTPPDLSACPDKDSRKLASKEHDQALKEYKRAVKDRDNAIKERAKAEARIAKEAKKEEERAQKAKAKEEKERAKDAQSEQPLNQKSGEELRLEQERQRMEAEAQRMADSERERMRVQREMLGQPAETEEKNTSAEAVQQAPKNTSSETVQQAYEETPTYHRRSASLTPSVCSRTPSPSPAHHRHTSSSGHVSTLSSSLSPPTGPSTPGKRKKDRKFCVLPSKDSRTGQRDPAWVRVFMENMDEVSAHCGLFFVTEQYERLVGEVAETIERWVLDDVSERALRELNSQII